MSHSPCLTQFAAFAARICCDILPHDVVRKAEWCVMEAAQNLLSHGDDPRKCAVLNAIRTFSREQAQQVPGLVRLMGTDLFADMEDAAYYHAMCISVDPRLDSHRAALCHPGSVAIPVAFATAEAAGKGRVHILEGIVAGYEAMIRLGLALGGGGILPSVRRTALCAAFCGAVTAAKVLELPAQGIEAAASLACHFSFGLNEWAITGTGEDAFHSAWGAKCGIMAAKLALHGAPAAAAALDGDKGLFAAYRVEDGASVFLRGLGESWLIQEVEHKPVAACLLLQSPCQAAAHIRSRYAISADDIRHIRVYVSGQVLRQPGMARSSSIDTEGQATNSVPYGVAAHLCCDGSAVRWLPPFDCSVLELAARCELLEDPALTPAFPRAFPCRIEIELLSGGAVSYALEDYIPLSFEDSKANLLAALRAHGVGPGQRPTGNALLDFVV